MSICPHVQSICPHVHMSICLCSWPCPWTRPRTWTYRYMDYGHVDIWTFSVSNLHVHINTVAKRSLMKYSFWQCTVWRRDFRKKFVADRRKTELSPISEILTSFVKTLGELQFRSKYFCETHRKRDSLQNSCQRYSQKTSLAINFF
jgi:hypothetical protein